MYLSSSWVRSSLREYSNVLFACRLLYRIIPQDLHALGFNARKNIDVNPNLAKAGGLRSQGAKGEAPVCYCEPLATPNLEASGFMQY
jgi:hypothetical protein